MRALYGAARYAAAFAGSLIVVGIGSILLFFLGRPLEEEARHVVVVDDEHFDPDDPGEEVDEGSRHL